MTKKWLCYITWHLRDTLQNTQLRSPRFTADFVHSTVYSSKAPKSDKIRFLKKPFIPTHKRQQMRSNAGKNVGKICGFGGEITEGSGT